MVDAGNERDSVFYTLSLMTMLFTCNFYSIIACLYVMGVKIKLGLDETHEFIVLYVGVMAALYILLLQGSTQAEFQQEYISEPVEDVKKGRLAVISYIVSSIVGLMLSFYLMTQKNLGNI